MAALIKQDRKIEIIDKIRHEGMSVANASVTYGVSTKTLYGWLKHGIGDANTLELNRLRRENDQLYRIVGELTRELKTQKK